MFFFNLKLRSHQNGFLKASLTSDERREKVSVGIRCDDLWCCAFDDLMRSSSSSNVHLVASALGNHSQPVATRLYVAMLHKSINNFTFCMYRFWGSAARWIPRVSILMTLFAAKRLDFCAIFIRLAFLVQVHYNWTSCSQQGTKMPELFAFRKKKLQNDWKLLQLLFKRN